jgi:excisionase family DNA binding protein
MPKHETQAGKNKPEGIFWTVREVAAYCNCSTGSVWNWMREGVLPAYGPGKVVRFKAEDVERLMAQPR